MLLRRILSMIHLYKTGACLFICEIFREKISYLAQSNEMNTVASSKIKRLLNLVRVLYEIYYVKPEGVPKGSNYAAFDLEVCFCQGWFLPKCFFQG